MSHSAEKNQKGDPLASDGFVDYVKKVQNERGDPLETKKFSKSRTVPKKNRKNRKGGLCSPVRFCKLPRKRFALNLPWPYLPDWAPWVVSGLFLKSGPISVRLKKKKGHCYSRAFFLKRIKRRLKTFLQLFTFFKHVWKKSYSAEQKIECRTFWSDTA